MEKNNGADQFLSLAQNIRHHAPYLSELGIEHSDEPLRQPDEDRSPLEKTTVKTPPRVPAALRRNAEVATQPTIAPPTPPFARISSGPPAPTEYNDMPQTAPKPL